MSPRCYFCDAAIPVGRGVWIRVPVGKIHTDVLVCPHCANEHREEASPDD